MSTVWSPVTFDEQPPALRVVGTVVMPVVAGAVCGLLLGVSEAVYLVLSLLCIAGGVVAGREHRGPLAGLARGLWGGTLFGLAILAVHELTGADAKASLPDPPVLLAVLTGLIGAGLGALGAWTRRRDAARSVAA